MDTQEHIEKIAEKMQQQGWTFYGPILHYPNAWKDQAGVYEKDGSYIVSGLDASGQHELSEPIDKVEAEHRVEESIKEIKKNIFPI